MEVADLEILPGPHLLRIGRAGQMLSLPGIFHRFPDIAESLLAELSLLQASNLDQCHSATQCLYEAEAASKYCSNSGFVARPLWHDLAAGLRQPDAMLDYDVMGEWTYGW